MQFQRQQKPGAGRTHIIQHTQATANLQQADLCGSTWTAIAADVTDGANAIRNIIGATALVSVVCQYGSRREGHIRVAVFLFLRYCSIHSSAQNFTPTATSSVSSAHQSNFMPHPRLLPDEADDATRASTTCIGRLSSRVTSTGCITKCRRTGQFHACTSPATGSAAPPTSSSESLPVSRRLPSRWWRLFPLPTAVNPCRLSTEVSKNAVCCRCRATNEERVKIGNFPPKLPGLLHTHGGANALRIPVLPHAPAYEQVKSKSIRPPGSSGESPALRQCVEAAGRRRVADGGEQSHFNVVSTHVPLLYVTAAAAASRVRAARTATTTRATDGVAMVVWLTCTAAVLRMLCQGVRKFHATVH